MNKKRILILLLVIVAVATGIYLWWWCSDHPARDEAFKAGIPVEFFRQPADEPDYFRDADGGIELTPAEVRGRNTWWVWGGGDEAYWDWQANHSFGTMDLLKTASSFPCSQEQEDKVRGYEEELVRKSSDGEGYDEGAYGSGGYATPPGGYGGDYEPDYGEAAGYEGYQGVCADTVYPEGGKAYYRYYTRDTRFCYLGLNNEPGFRKATQPDKWGVCLDERTDSADPYPEEVYGRPSGIMGLRIYDNPNFDAKAQKKWDPVRFYTDPNYYSRPELVRPYRVAMACGFCHISPHPLHPPKDPENSQFANLSGTIGAQYFWFGRVFGVNVTPDNFAWSILDAQLPGTVDTSFIPQDGINNARPVNALYNIPERLRVADQYHVEKFAGGNLVAPEVVQNGDSFGVPHVLWDGADSVGIDIALTRVYLNIGEYHQEWVRHFNAIIGGKSSPIKIADAQKYSIYWQATQERAGDLAAYLIRAGYPYRLADVGAGPGTRAEEEEAAEAGDEPAPPAYGSDDGGDDSSGDDDGGYGYGGGSGADLERGKVLFAETCARCHSSKLPPDLPGLGPGLGLECAGEPHLRCWKEYWEHTETEEFKSAMRDIVLDPDFLVDNYLSNDERIPVHQPLIDWTPPSAPDPAVAQRYRDAAAARGEEISDTLIAYLERARARGPATGALEGEICTSMASNGLQGHIWDNVTSQSYKQLPAIGTVELYDPVRDLTFDWQTPAGGRGYIRVPSLIGVWTSAPFLHNNSLGRFSANPSVAGRLAAFDEAIRKLLWPETRPHLISRARERTNVYVSTSALPKGPLRGLAKLAAGDEITIGPFPKRTPVNLIANIMTDTSDPRFSIDKLLPVVKQAIEDLKTLSREDLTDEQETELLKNLVPGLISVSNCPDFVADRGHYFGSDLSDGDKEALIQFLLTF